MGWRDWTGVGERRWKKAPDEEVRPGKTLWDWLQLLVVPVILIVVTLYWSAQQTAKSDRAATEDARRDVTLKTYLDQMSGLMLDKGLLASRPRSAIRAVARTLTLTTLRRLDGERKAEVIRFLFEARLLDRSDPLVNLDFADLRGADLKGANLTRANLTRANLADAELALANLTNADLEGADLRGANLTRANLADAELALANLTNADLRGANLTRADLLFTDLTRAKNLNLDRFITDLPPNDRKDFLDALDSLSPAELAKFNLTPERLAKLRREANGG